MQAYRFNVESSDDLNRAICSEGFGNPLLVQEICSELCIKNGILERVAETAPLDASKLEEALTEIAKSKGFPKFSKLSSRFQPTIVSFG